MKSKKLKRVLLVLGIILIFIIGFIIGNLTSRLRQNSNLETETTTQIREIEVETQTIENTLTSSGQMLSSSTDNLSLATTRYFKTMCVEENDIVKAGENILEYTNGTYLTAEYDCLISGYSVPETGSKCTSSHYVTVENIATIAMQVSISESEINKVKKGQEVQIELSAMEDKIYTGSITNIDNAGTYSASGTTFSAMVEFSNDGNVKPGMSASCTIVLEKAEDCVAVPINAVQVQDNQKYVVVVKEDGTTENVNIETGISNADYVQVKSGIEVGQKIQMVEIITTNSGFNNMRGSIQNRNSQRGSRESQSESFEIPSGGSMPEMLSGGKPNM